MLWMERFLDSLVSIEDGAVNPDLVYTSLIQFIYGTHADHVATLFNAFDCKRTGAVEVDELCIMVLFYLYNTKILRSI